MTISVAKEANTSPVGNNRACSNGGSRKDKCSDGEGTGTGGRGVSQKRPLCYRSRLGKKLLCLWRIWAHCRNRRRIAEERRVKFEGNYKYSNTLKGEENLESLN